MTTPEEQSFDHGFSHGYPRDRGLVERLEIDTGRRIITELVPENDELFQRLSNSDYQLFEYEEITGARTHFIPADARDLPELIRLAKDSDRVIALGQLLGRNLSGIINATHAFPGDTVLPRFAGHSSNNPLNSLGGVELKLLPPFDHFTDPATRSIDRGFLLEMIEGDLLEISNILDQKFDDFIEGFNYGMEG